MKYLLFILLFAFTSSLLGQDKAVISGKILDAEVYNEPLLMANVSLKGTAWSTQTNFNGNFELANVSAGAYTLQIDFLGYQRLELSISVLEGERLDILQVLSAKKIQLPTDFAALDNEHTTLTASKTNTLKK